MKGSSSTIAYRLRFETYRVRAPSNYYSRKLIARNSAWMVWRLPYDQYISYMLLLYISLLFLSLSFDFKIDEAVSCIVSFLFLDDVPM